MKRPTARPQRAARPAAAGWSAPIAPLVARADADAAAELGGLAEGADKALAKEARRALYALKQAGIELPAREPHDAPALQEASPQPVRAMATNVDGGGSQMLAFVRNDRWGGNPWFVQAIVNYDDGLQTVEGGKTARREVDELISRIRSETRGFIVDIPADYARTLLAEAVRVRRAAGRPLPPGFPERERAIGPPEQQYHRPLIYDYVNAEDVGDDLSVSHDPERLLTRTGFHGWMPDVRAIRPWVERYVAAGQTRIVLSQHQQAQLGERVVDEATDALMGGAGLDALRRRLEEQALVLHLAGHEEAAKEAVYQASTMPVGVSPHMAPFARAFVRHGLAEVLRIAAEHQEQSQERKGPHEQPGLIYRIDR